MSRWKQWVEKLGGGGKETLSGSLVAKQVATPGNQHQVCPDTEELAREQRRRQLLLESLWLNRPGSKAQTNGVVLVKAGAIYTRMKKGAAYEPPPSGIIDQLPGRMVWLFQSSYWKSRTFTFPSSPT